MKRRARWVTLGAVALGLAFGLAGCTGFWQTAVQLPKLIVGPVMVTGTEGYVLISVIDMPDGGLASIQFGTVGNEAIDHSDIDETTIVSVGKNGFVVLAEAYTATKATLLAVNGTTGILGGEILRFTFTVTGANPTFTVDKTNVELKLADDANTFITVWDLSTTDYHTR